MFIPGEGLAAGVMLTYEIADMFARNLNALSEIVPCRVLVFYECSWRLERYMTPHAMHGRGILASDIM